MTDQPPPEQGIQAEPPATATPSETGISETGISETAQRADASDVIPLPPMAPLPASVAPAIDTGWTIAEGFLLVLAMVLAFFLGSYAAGNSDFWQHLATGRAIVQGTHEFGVDPYSFGSVRDGAPVAWVNHSWLFDVVLYGLFSAFGGRGVGIFQGLVMVAIFMVILRARPADSSRLVAVLFGALTVMLVSLYLPLNSLLMSYLLLGITMLLLWRGGALGGLADDDEPSPRALWLLPAVFLLWVNLDAWFMLGLAVVALCFLGNGIGNILGWPSRVSGKTQALVLAASVTACVINPYHVRTFVVPPDLAWFFGSWLPPELSAGGETLRGLTRHDGELLARTRLAGPFYASLVSFFNATQGGYFNVIHCAYILLLVLTGASAVLLTLNARRADGPPLPLGRLVPWAILLFLSLALYRLIPMFALIAGPVTLLNFTDLARWWRSRPGALDQRGFNPGLARLAGGVLLLLALGLAWPGWLHVAIGMNSPRRVAWRVQEDPSLRAAAESLAQAQAKRVFNLSADVADYCSWFAPGVRCFLDGRLELFSQQAVKYAKAKKDLREHAQQAVEGQGYKKPDESDWRDLFNQMTIDHLVVTRFLDPQNTPIAQMCWMEGNYWAPGHADGRTLVFAWLPHGKGSPIDIDRSWKREAFGPVAESDRAPMELIEPPGSGPSWMQQYLEGEPLTASRQATEPFVHAAYFRLVRKHWVRSYAPAWHISAWLAPAGLGATAPGSVLGPYALCAASSPLSQVGRPRDGGPPSAPILMIRNARRALHQNPYEPLGYKGLYQAYKLQAFLVEEEWAAQSGPSPAENQRVALRQLQMVAALRNYLDLAPDDWQMRLEFAQLLRNQHNLDAGYEQILLAKQTIEERRRMIRDKDTQEMLKNLLKDVSEVSKEIERDLKRRRTDYELESARAEPIRKFQVAAAKPYKTIDANNREVTEYRGMGLTLEGLKQLQSVSPESLKEGERNHIYYLRARLFLNLGRINEATAELLRLPQGPEAHEIYLWHAAVIGDYEQIDGWLSAMEQHQERAMPLELARARVRYGMLGLLQGHIGAHMPSIARVHAVFWPRMSLFPLEDSIHAHVAKRANWRTMRGIFALEVGDTGQALEHFTEAERVAGAEGRYPDRPIAQRYLELLREQKK